MLPFWHLFLARVMAADGVAQWNTWFWNTLEHSGTHGSTVEHTGTWTRAIFKLNILAVSGVANDHVARCLFLQGRDPRDCFTAFSCPRPLKGTGHHYTSWWVATHQFEYH